MGRLDARRAVRVLGYLRVSTVDQDYGIEVQRAAILAEAEKRGWTSIQWITDFGKTGKKIQRPGLDQARLLLGAGKADLLVVSKLDRLSRSVADFTGLVREATHPARGRKAWRVVVLDPGIDMTTPNGRLVANILMSVAEWEGEIISDRTKAALAQAKAQGKRLGALPQIEPAVARRMKRLRGRGWTLARIADHLNADGVPTPNGGRYHPSTVDAVLKRISRR